MISRLAGGVKFAVLALALLLVIVAAVTNPEGTVHAAKAAVGGIGHAAKGVWAWCARIIRSL